MTRIESIASLYKAITGDADITSEELDVYAGTDLALETISSALMQGTVGGLGLSGLAPSSLVDRLYADIFGYTDAEVEAMRDADDSGFVYWENELANNSAVINANTLAIALINGAEEGGADDLAAAALVADEVAAYAEYTPTDPVDPEVEGDTFDLTSGTDKLTGTADNDTFDGGLVQNAFAGGVSNSLSSADELDGGAGTDTLNAEVVAEFVGATSDYQIDVQPETTDIEIVTFEARDSGSNDTTTILNDAGNLVQVDANSLVTVDAKYMTGLDKIGSLQSDGDLIIENLTTLTDDGVARNTSELTITMDHTDNFNSDEDASDLTVYFDEDYLLTGETTSGASLTIRLLNAVQNEAGNNPVDGFSAITFNVGTTEVEVDISTVAEDATQDFTTAYAAIVDLINAKLIEEGFDTVTASAPALEDAVFSIPVAGFTTGDDAGDYYPIILTNTGSEALTGVDIETSALEYDTDLNNSFSTEAPESNTDPISVNIELEKVGREGEGGDLKIGGKSQDADEGEGITEFNITVLGDDDKPSNLGMITSTNGALTTVNIASDNDGADTYASLTVRGEAATPFGGTLDTLNANAFKGDLRVGIETAAENIDTFTATGGGDVTLVENIGTTAETAAEGDGEGFASAATNAYTVTTGAGSDNITVDADSGAQLTVNTGAGSDTIGVTIDGDDISGSTLTKAFIVSNGGDNTVTVDSGDAVHEADITLGSGADTVTGNDVIIDANTGAGNDTIYTSNTATKAKIVNDLTDNATDALGASTIAGNTGATPDYSELLFGRSVVVTLGTEGVAADELVQGFESISIDIEASNGYLTTTTDLHNAIAKAINTDDTLSKLAKATVDSNGQLVVQYLVDGAVDVDTNAALEYTISGDWADLDSTDQSAILAQLEEENSDSDLTFEIADGANSLEAAYDNAGITTAQTILDNATGVDGVDSAIGENNTVNAGLGDDVIVLSSDDGATDTIEIDANGFGNDVVVHYEAGATGDVIDFAHLDNVTSASGSSVSEVDVAGTIAAVGAIIENSVVVTDMSTINDNDAGIVSALNFDTMTDAQVKNELNAAGTEFAGGISDGTLVGDKLSAIIMIEDDANTLPADDNEGFYKVYEIVYDATDSEFDSVTLVGTLDFEAAVVFNDANIA